MTLYSLRTDGDQYRITKFNNDGDVESSYLCTEYECECPAGVRPSCRHRQMLPQMLAHKIANSEWFMDWDHGAQIVNFAGQSKRLLDQLAASQMKTMLDELADIPGVHVLTLGDPAALHNTIAEAVGEPTIPAKPWRRM